MPDVRQVGQHEIERGDAIGHEIRTLEGHAVGDGMAHRVLAGQVQCVGRDIGREQHDRLGGATPAQGRGERDGDRATPRADVDDPDWIGAG